MKQTILKHSSSVMFAFFLCISLVFASVPEVSVSAHSGRTDSQGGHRDNKNVSGLGSYHYHCGGYPAHLHTDGICPYASSSASSTGTGNNTGSTSSTKTGNSAKTETTSSSKKTNKAKLSKTSLTLLKGKSKTLKLSGVSGTVTWSSSDKAVATVNKNGKVTAVAKGKATITAKCGSVKKTCKVKVEAPKISKTKLTLKPGEETTLKISGTSQEVTWSSSNDAIWVDDDGGVYAYDIGSATVTASVGTSETGIVKLKCKVTSATPKVKKLTLNKSKASMQIGDSLSLKAVVTPTEVLDYEDMSWFSSDETVVTVDGDGTVQAMLPGAAIITVSIGGKTATCQIVVTEAK